MSTKKEPSKFLLLPKEGKPTFLNENPWDYIKRVNMRVVKDYFNLYHEIDLSKSTGIHSLKFTYGYGIVFFNPIGLNNKEERCGGEELNKIATSFYNAYGAVYEGNRKNIYSEALIIKTDDYRQIKDMNTYDVRRLKEMLKDAIKWF